MASAMQYGIRANWRQILQQLLRVLFVGMALGMMRTVVPALAESEFGVPRYSFMLLVAFVVAFGLVKGTMNFVAPEGATANIDDRVEIWPAACDTGKLSRISRVTSHATQQSPCKRLRRRTHTKAQRNRAPLVVATAHLLGLVGAAHSDVSRLRGWIERQERAAIGALRVP